MKTGFWSLIFWILFFSGAGQSRALCMDQSMQKPSSGLTTTLTIVKKLYLNHPDSALLISKEGINLARLENKVDEHIELLILQTNIYRQLGRADDMYSCLVQAEALSTQCKNKKIISRVFYEKANFYYKTGQSEKIGKPLQHSIAIKKEIEDSLGLSRCNILLGHTKKENPDTAIHYYNQAFLLAQQMKDTTYMANAMGNIANTYLRSLGDYDNALEKFEECLPLFEQIDQKAGVAQTYSNISTIFLRKKDNAKAIEYQLKNLAIREEINDVPGQINALSGLGSIHHDMKRMEDARHYFNRAISQSIKSDWLMVLPSLYNNMGANFVFINKDSAQYYCEKAIEISEELNDFNNLCAAKVNLASVHSNEKQYERAEYLYLEAYGDAKKADDQRLLKNLEIGLVDFYLKWINDDEGLEKQKPQLDELETVLEDMENSNRFTESIETMEMLYKAFAYLKYTNNDLPGTIHYQQKLINLRDSLFQNVNIDAANEWAEKFKTKEKENEIVKLEAKNKLAAFKNKIFAWALGGTIFFFTILGFLLWKYLKQQNEKKKIEEAQLFRSKLSMDLHDEVGSILSNLSMQSQLAAMNVSSEIKEDLNAIVRLSQQAMENMRDTVWLIDSRKDKYDNLLDRMLEYGEKSLSAKNIQFEITKNNLTEGLKIAPEKRQNIFLIFKEATTNIIKHSNGNKVSVSARQQGSFFHLSIKDNGSSNEANKSDGLGLSNMKHRAEKIGGSIEFNHDEGFHVLLKVPV